MGRDHSCEVCGKGGLNDPDGACECGALRDALEELVGAAESVRRIAARKTSEFDNLIGALTRAKTALEAKPTDLRPSRPDPGGHR